MCSLQTVTILQNLMIAIENLNLKSETYNESCAYIVLKSLKKSDKQIARFALKNNLINFLRQGITLTKLTMFIGNQYCSFFTYHSQES